MDSGSARAYHEVREAPLLVAVDLIFILATRPSLLLLLLLFMCLDLLPIYCFDSFYLSINSSWLFLFPFLTTGRDWMAAARDEWR